MKATCSMMCAVLMSALALPALRADDAAPGAAAAAGVKPAITKVNLHLQQAMPEDAFDELAKQGGVKFTNQGNLWDQQGMQTENDIDMTDRPFWSAVNEVCGLWGISAQPGNMYGGGNNPKHIMLINYGNANGQKTKAPVFESDGILVQAVSFNRQQSINYSNPQQSQNFCSLQMMVYVDPAIHVSSISQSPKVEVAVDDEGNSWVPDRNSNMFYGGNQQKSLIYQYNVPLKYPDKVGKKLADVKFTISMRASDSVDSLSVDKPLAAAETSKDFGDTTVTFHSLKKNGNGYELKLSMTRDDQGGNNAWNLLQTAQLLDSKGRTYGYGGGGGGGGADDMAEYNINYQSFNNGQDEAAAGEPAKWVLELPTKSHAIKLPVEFKDLALP